MRSCYKTILTASVAGLTALVSLNGGPAYADEPTTDREENAAITRVIDRTDANVPRASGRTHADMVKLLEKADIVATPGVIELPSGVELEVGETIQINYADGTVVYAAPMAGCVTSTGASPPIVNAGNAWTLNEHSSNSGCSGVTYNLTGQIQSKTLGAWWTRASTTKTLYGGQSLAWPTKTPCIQTTNAEWRGRTLIGGTLVAQSSATNIPCAR